MEAMLSYRQIGLLKEGSHDLFSDISIINKAIASRNTSAPTHRAC